MLSGFLFGLKAGKAREDRGHVNGRRTQGAQAKKREGREKVEIIKSRGSEAKEKCEELKKNRKKSPTNRSLLIFPPLGLC